MQILSTKKFLLSTTALFILGACATTTPAPEEEEEDDLPICTFEGELDCEEPEQEECFSPMVGDGKFGCEYPGAAPLVVTSGTIDPDDSSNGMRFADGIPILYFDLFDIPEDIDDYNAGTYGEERTLTLQGAKIYTKDNTYDGDLLTAASADLVDIEITTFMNEGNEWIITADVGGETALINYAETQEHCYGSDGVTTSSAGINYCFNVAWFNENLYFIYAYPEDWRDQETSIWTAFAGLETDPDLLDYKGLATYLGGFDLRLASVSEDWTDKISGGIEINADFGAADISGFLSDSLDPDGIVGIEFDGIIAGNGWAATVNEEDLEGLLTGEFDEYDIVVGGAQLDGVFYGATGDDTAGSIVLDATLTTGEEFDPEFDEYADIVGAGWFSAEEGGNFGDQLSD